MVSKTPPRKEKDKPQIGRQYLQIIELIKDCVQNIYIHTHTYKPLTVMRQTT